MKKKFKAKNGKTYTFNRLWCNNNLCFCDKGKINKKKVSAIVIHNTGGSNDTAKNVANYFKNNVSRFAGAQFIIDEKGNIYQCGRLKDACYAVGGTKYNNCNETGGGKYYGKINNYNSISIELCGITDNMPTKKQTEATKAVIEYIRKYCPNAKKILRHFDVTGKDCPQIFAGNASTKKGEAWSKFKKELSK